MAFEQNLREDPVATAEKTKGKAYLWEVRSEASQKRQALGPG